MHASFIIFNVQFLFANAYLMCDVALHKVCDVSSSILFMMEVVTHFQHQTYDRDKPVVTMCQSVHHIQQRIAARHGTLLFYDYELIRLQLELFLQTSKIFSSYYLLYTIYYLLSQCFN